MFKLEKLPRGDRKSPSVYLVKDPARGEGDAAIVGMLEKYSNTRTERHPWKAFSGSGMHREFLRTFYPEEGGKAAALEAIADAM